MTIFFLVWMFGYYSCDSIIFYKINGNSRNGDHRIQYEIEFCVSFVNFDMNHSFIHWFKSFKSVSQSVKWSVQYSIHIFSFLLWSIINHYKRHLKIDFKMKIWIIWMFDMDENFQKNFHFFSTLSFSILLIIINSHNHVFKEQSFILLFGTKVS